MIKKFSTPCNSLLKCYWIMLLWWRWDELNEGSEVSPYPSWIDSHVRIAIAGLSYANARSIILRYLMLICQRKKEECSDHWTAVQHAMQQNCAIERRRTRAKIEGLIVLWLIFNLSRLFPAISHSIRHQEARERENERQLKACKRCFNNIMDRRGMCNDMKFTSETLSLFW